MSRPTLRIGPWMLALAIIGALGVTVIRLAGPPPLDDRVEAALLDLRFRLRGPVAPPPDLLIVALDEASLASAAGLAGTRAMLADAIERADAAGVAAIAVDLLLLDSTGADMRLATALAASDRVAIAVAAQTNGRTPPTPRSPEVLAALERSLFGVVAKRGDAASEPLAPPPLLLPRPGFAAAARLGHVNIIRAEDRVARQGVVALPVEEDGVSGALPALPIVAAGIAANLERGEIGYWTGTGVSLGQRQIPTAPDGTVTLNHYGPAGTIESVSLLALAAGAVSPDRLSGRVLFIGATAESLRDVFATPFGPDTPGVEVLATFGGNLIDGSAIRRDGTAALATIGLAVPLAALAFWAALPGSMALGLALSALVWLAGGVALAQVFASWQLWADALAVIASLGIGSGAGVFVRERAARRGAAALKREKANIARFLPAGLAATLAEGGRPAFDRRLQRCAVLFVDVEGYTARSEAEDPVAVADFLARLHALFEEAAIAHGGVVIDFLGDGAMVVFGLPEPAEGDAAAAIACARRLVARGPAELGEPGRPVRLRVSVHHGPVAAAILGGPRQAHATVTGDTVNLASRLQDTAKAHGAALVVTRATLEAAGLLDAECATGFAFLATETPRGRQGAVEVWSAVDAGSA